MKIKRIENVLDGTGVSTTRTLVHFKNKPFAGDFIVNEKCEVVGVYMGGDVVDALMQPLISDETLRPLSEFPEGDMKEATVRALWQALIGLKS